MKSKVAKSLYKMYGLMRMRFGHQAWWPGQSAFEIAVGAILTQNTSWIQVEKAIRNLKKAGVLSPRAMYKLSARRLAQLIQPSGFFNVKQKRLRHFLGYLAAHHRFSMKSLTKKTTKTLRQELLAVHGIGQETADSILLYACNKPSFVVDAYTRRVLSRHGMTSDDAPYEQMQEIFMRHLPKKVDLYNDFHAQIVMIGKNYCRPKPRCEQCPLNTWEKTGWRRVRNTRRQG